MAARLDQLLTGLNGLLAFAARLFGETAGWLVETRRRHAHRCVENTGSWPSSCWETGRDYLNCPGRKDH